ncbi:hypothetical protein ACN2CX_07925 [Aliarcobacter butzleri]|uniref:hypothetical protein n=3 Tax=Aliarcobacter butzleri TaxID=28197 RepID=UPI003AFB1EDD
MKNIITTNGKGGASKSTSTMQVCGAYSLDKEFNVKIWEFDDENKDSQNFTKSAILSEQIEVGDGAEITTTLRDLFTNNNDADVKLFDVGGNKTTTIFLEGLKKSRMFKKVDLFVIPMSGGSQDLKNAIKTLETILEMDSNANIMFCLSRVRNPKRVQFQYGDFFSDNNLKKYPYIILKDSDVIDLSRKLKKSVYELATDLDSKKGIEDAFDKALDEDDSSKITSLSIMLEIYDEAEDYLKTTLIPAFKELDKALNKDKKMSNELSANEVIKIVQELKALERRFGGEKGLINHLIQISENLNNQNKDIDNSKKELGDLFQKLQDSKNIKLEIETLKLDFVGKKEFDDLTQLVKYINGFKSFMIQKTNEINNSYIKLNKLWFEEDDVLKKIEYLEKNLLSKVLLGGVGIGILLTITIIVIARYFL